MEKYLIILITIFMFNKTYGCSCLEELTLKEEIENSDFIATGKVISFERFNKNYKLEYIHNMDGSLRIPKEFSRQSLSKYKILISHIFKGDINSDTLTIFTGVGGGDCGYFFEINKDYTIFGSRNNYFDLANSNSYQIEGADIVWTNDCTFTSQTDFDITNALNERFKNKIKRKLNWEESKIDSIRLKNLVYKIIKINKSTSNQLVLKVKILESGNIEVEDMNFLDQELNEETKETLLLEIQKSMKNFKAIPRMINEIPKQSKVLIEL
jgi:hypothetical protein